MNIQLYFENTEVELNDSISFPLNKSFENLWNPTDIIIPYSKSINIPASKANNILMANAYRLDRKFAINEGENPNIGMYLDPLKRIPMKLVHNGTLLLDGYAKYTSATMNDKETYYTFNLYGSLGDVFQKLLDCVFDENKLTDEQKAEPDGGAKYIIQTPWDKELIDKEFVYNSWKSYDRSTLSNSSPYKHIGMAPANRGLYDNFNSDTYYGYYANYIEDKFEYKAGTIEELLKNSWMNTLRAKGTLSDDEIQERVESINMDLVLPNGTVNEQQLNQYRSYEQKPYIYFDSLMKLYQNKCKELTGYEIKLDSKWFNKYNPYWNKLCYMLDYLSVRGNTLDSTQSFTGYVDKMWDYGNAGTLPRTTVSYNISDANVLAMNNIELKPFTICLNNAVYKKAGHSELAAELRLANNCPILIEVAITSNGNTSYKHFWSGTSYASVTNINPDRTKYNANNFITVSEVCSFLGSKLTNKTYITIPSITIPHTSGKDLSIDYNISIYRYYSRTKGPYAYRYSGEDLESVTPIHSDPDFTVTIPNTQFSTNWRTTTTCDMKNLYAKEDSLFKVIIQYTKAFGLIWDVDYINKTISILTRKSYFDDYQVLDWTNKVDKSKGLTIEPVAFSSQYVSFNYKDTDGYHYAGYKTKYGVDYGEKKLKTKYNFDKNTLDLFKDTSINPSSVSSKSYYSLSKLTAWDTYSTLKADSYLDLIDSENEDQTASVVINNWYFRNKNHTITDGNVIALADASQMELNEDKYYWVEPLNSAANSRLSEVFPSFSPVCKSEYDSKYYGCIYNCPNEDYTRDKLISTAKGNYIYDICWSDYINERYNANNKKVTCYLYITPNEFKQFNSKTFIVIDNQLFVINKIMDYNPNNPITKVELIQVSDINGYLNTRFDFGDVVEEDEPDNPDTPDTPDTPDEPTIKPGSSYDNPIYLDFYFVNSDVYSGSDKNSGKCMLAMVATTDSASDTRLVNVYDLQNTLTGEIHITTNSTKPDGVDVYDTVIINDGQAISAMTLYEDIYDAVDAEWTVELNGGADSSDGVFEEGGVFYRVSSINGFENGLDALQKVDSLSEYVAQVQR